MIDRVVDRSGRPARVDLRGVRASRPRGSQGGPTGVESRSPGPGGPRATAHMGIAARYG